MNAEYSSVEYTLSVDIYTIIIFFHFINDQCCETKLNIILFVFKNGYLPNKLFPY